MPVGKTLIGRGCSAGAERCGRTTPRAVAVVAPVHCGEGERRASEHRRDADGREFRRLRRSQATSATRRSVSAYPTLSVQTVESHRLSARVLLR